MKGVEKHATDTGVSKLLEEIASLRADMKSLHSKFEKQDDDMKSLQLKVEEPEGNVKSLQSTEKHQRDLNSLKSKVDEHEAGFRLLPDAWWRAFLT